ncbi:LytR/AlgR family response regulator transcription factor [Massilia consociata]|uniref:LytR/AlgR family response regulator transcription factor n=1 Tax=Massilia consociata TaxID=760117 RepID=A0ABV6FD23_9BURK
MPTAVIADDEDLQRTELRRLLALAWPELAIVAACEDGDEALAAIADLRPDVAFLDIRMPGMSGLDVAKASAGSCRVVFTTAYDSHAIEAFDLGAVDYLVKPVAGARLEQAVTRLRAQLATGTNAAELVKALEQLDRRLRPAAQAETIRWISSTVGNVIKMFPIEEVLFFESDTRYTRVVSATDEGLLRMPIKELAAGLDPDRFWQIRRGTLVCARAIARVRRDELGNFTVELRDHSAQLKVGQTYAWRFRNEVLMR